MKKKNEEIEYIEKELNELIRRTLQFKKDVEGFLEEED